MRAQHDARISVGASANNLILAGLLCSRSSVLRVGLLCITAEVGKARHGCAVGRRDVHQIPDVRLQPGILGEFHVSYDREIQPAHTVTDLRCVCVKEEANALCVGTRIRREQVSE